MDLEQQLREALAPCEPGPKPEAVVMAKISSVVQRKPNRFILVSTILVVAAAAAMLTMQLRSTSAPRTAVVASDSVIASAPAGMATSEVIAEVVDTSASEAAAPVPKSAEEQPYTVQVLPLQYGAEGVAKSPVEAFHTAFLVELRRVPGLVLLLADSAEPDDDVAPDFQLVVRGFPSADASEFIANVSGDTKGMVISKQKMRREGKEPGVGDIAYFVRGDISPPCASTAEKESPKCTGPEGRAADVVLRLRKGTFPADPSLRRLLLPQLVNASLSPRERLTALRELAGLKSRPSANGALPTANGALQDAAVIRGAMDLAAATSDPALRAQIWRAMRGSRLPEVLQSAIAALGQDPSGAVRLQIILILQEGFSEDSRARGALEAASRGETRPMMRALAQRALTGDADWKEYVLKSLKDNSRSDAERLEAFMYDLVPYESEPGGPVRISSQSMRALKSYDDEAIQALADLLPKSPRLRDSEMILPMIMGELGSLDRPAVTSLLLGLAENGAEPTVRYAAVNHLGRRKADSRVRAALEKLSTEAADPQLRETAVRALQGSSGAR